VSYTFTKLFSSITSSTVWMEPSGTRLTWIAMLANADRKGRVFASLPGLAHLARVTLEECEAAITTFLAPDKFSRTPAHEGRRIEPIEGGWQLLNYAYYRGIRDEEDTRASKREYMREQRAKGKGEVPRETDGKSGTSGSTSGTVEPGGPKQKQRQRKKQSEKATAPCSPPPGDGVAPAADVPRGTRAQAIRFDKFIESLAGAQAIPPDDPIFKYAADAKLPRKYIALAWFAFRQYHLDRPDKKQLDWRAVFRNYVRENYLKLWRTTPEGYELTDKGEQQTRAKEAADAERARG
jgi:hypothetical protein